MPRSNRFPRLIRLIRVMAPPITAARLAEEAGVTCGQREGVAIVLMGARNVSKPRSMPAMWDSPNAFEQMTEIVRRMPDGSNLFVRVE